MIIIDYNNKPDSQYLVYVFGSYTSLLKNINSTMKPEFIFTLRHWTIRQFDRFQLIKTAEQRLCHPFIEQEKHRL